MGQYDYENFAEYAKKCRSTDAEDASNILIQKVSGLDGNIHAQNQGEPDWDRATGDHLSIANSDHFSIPPRFLKYPESLEESVDAATFTVEARSFDHADLFHGWISFHCRHCSAFYIVL